MKISEREMILLVLSIATILFGGTWYYVDSKVPEYKNKRIEIERLEAQIRLDQRRISMQKDWIDTLNSLQKDLQVFDIKQKSVSPQLMQIIKNISTKHGIRIIRNQPYAEKPTGDLFEMGINCTWQGDLPSIVGFLTELQQKGVQYDIRTLNISPEGKKSGRLKGNMVIHCAYIKADKES
tara:strand:+ start:3165 stop:3704 length:540 start_codon:yes stop_codon:yes gene_type:complete